MKKFKRDKYKYKNINYDETLEKIKRNKKDFRRTIIILLIVSVLIIAIFLIRRYPYYKDYYKTTWYEGTAVLESSHKYTDKGIKIKESPDEAIRYKRFYTYIGKDEKEYIYTERDFIEQGEVGDELTIYIDEKDNSNSLKIIKYDAENKMICWIFIIAITPVIVIYFITFAILYFKKIVYKRKIKKEEKGK